MNYLYSLITLSNVSHIIISLPIESLTDTIYLSLSSEARNSSAERRAGSGDSKEGIHGRNPAPSWTQES